MSSTAITVKTVGTTPHEGQKPGTSGLRKRVRIFQQPNYTDNFVQAIFDATQIGQHGDAPSLVVGGDGRYFMKETIQTIIRIGIANGIQRFIVGKDGILSTPAGSHLIRSLGASGGILLTASHNPGGPEKDFGIKFNAHNGGPAPENVTDKIYECTRAIRHYHIAEIPDVDISALGSHIVGEINGKPIEVEVVDSVESYVELLKTIFDFALIKRFLKENPTFKVLFDGLNGVTGPYGRSLFVKEFGLPETTSVDQAVPLPDFGGGHPDPNLTYADKLVSRVYKEQIDFGAASDGDGDRNMVLGKDWFVTPSDSVAVIADYAHYLPYFKRTGIKGLARSMPTSQAIDRVAEAKKVEYFEVPTGWKFFGNLMDAGRLSICGEESFGTGSDHIREKDGLWAIIAWLNILAVVNTTEKGLVKPTGGPDGSVVTVRDIMINHFAKYGRNYFTRYDYEEVDGNSANLLIQELRDACKDGSHPEKLVGKSFNGQFVVASVDDFAYTDPIDGSVSKKQGVRIIFTDSSRIIFRLSGTGSQGATIRIYIEKYQEPGDLSKLTEDAQVALKPLVDVALEISRIQEFTGRSEPTVIT